MNIDNKSDYKPLPSYIEVRETLKKGKGIFTTKQLDKGHIVGVTHYEVADSDRSKFHQGLVRPMLGEMLNHSGSPNCRLVQEGSIYFLQILNPIVLSNTELTIDYERYKCGESYFCVKKIDEIIDEMKSFNPLFRQSDDSSEMKAQEYKEKEINSMINKLGDTEKGELIQKLEDIEQHIMVKHFNI